MPFRYGTLINPNAQNLSSLTQPFDLAIWILLLISLVSLCLYFRLVFKLKKKELGSILETHILSILLEQSQDCVTKCHKFSTSTYYLLISWLLATFLVGNAYKGVLFSFLTTPSLPQVPRNLQELAESQYLIATISGQAEFTATGEPEGVQSTAKLHIEQIVSDVERGQLQIKDSEKDYEKLRNMMIFFNPSIDESDLFTSIFMHVELSTGSKNYSVPKNLIFFDKDEQVKNFEELISIFSKNVLILGPTFDLFATRDQWLFQRNVFLRLALPFMEGMEESGIFTRWEYYHEAMKDYANLKSTLLNLNSSIDSDLTKISRKDNILAYLLFKPYTANVVSQPEPISLEFFSVFAKLFSYCIIVCFVVLILEFATTKWHLLRK